MTSTSCISIRSFQSGDATAFRELNFGWICEHFGIEHEDEALFNDPEGQIVRRGGDIFFVIDGNTPIGCCGLIPREVGTFELVKMTIAESHRGRGLGRLLLDHAITEARRLGATVLVLGSNTKLKPAIQLYESAGFRHLSPREFPNSPYTRVNVFMRKEF